MEGLLKESKKNSGLGDISGLALCLSEPQPWTKNGFLKERVNNAVRWEQRPRSSASGYDSDPATSQPGPEPTQWALKLF